MSINIRQVMILDHPSSTFPHLTISGASFVHVVVRQAPPPPPQYDDDDDDLYNPVMTMP